MTQLHDPTSKGLSKIKPEDTPTILHTESEWREAVPVLQQLRQSLMVERLLDRREELQSRGLRLIGGRCEGKLVAVASFLIYPHLSHGHDCWVHDLVTLEAYRGRGIAQQLMQAIGDIARDEGCSRVLVHTRNENITARLFYGEKLGMEQYAVVFKKDLE